MAQLTFVIGDKVPSHKNNMIVVRRRMVRNKKLEAARMAIGWKARQACLENNWTMLTKQAFGIEVEMIIDRVTGGDIDGVLTTILDALEGIIYDNDRYCMQVTLKRTIKKKALSQVYVTIYTLAEHDND